jgi:large subunit ribosomal protein L22
MLATPTRLAIVRRSCFVSPRRFSTFGRSLPAWAGHSSLLQIGLHKSLTKNEAMPYQATHRFARISARKVRPLADLIRGKYADEALDILRYQPHRGARLLEKVLKSALGNAESQRVQNPEGLVVTDARIDGGPMFKRIRPRARGMAFMIKKRMSHIRIALDEV